jgi:predicted DNA-binding protein (MmcQ/YjbR family)
VTRPAGHEADDDSAEVAAAVTRDQLLAHCLARPGAWEDEPWEGDVVVKVGSKIFAFLGAGPPAGQPATVGLKCGATREAAGEWLLRYPDDASVMPYIGRFGWNSLRIGGAIPDGELLEALDASYRAVLSKIPKKDRPAGRSAEPDGLG